MEKSNNFIKVLKPLYFDARKLPEVAYRITDVEPKLEGYVILSEMIDSSENIYLKGQPFTDIWEIRSTDPDATFHINHEVHKLGEGNFCFFKNICSFTSISILHKGPYEIHYYSIPDKIRSDLSVINTFNFFINNDLYIYKDGMISNIKNPTSSTLQGDYKRQYTKGTTKSTFVYSRTIQDLQSHPEMHNFAVGWDKTLIRHSIPPCIAVSINASEDAEAKFQEFAKKVCPDVEYQFLNIDSIEIERSEEEKDRECQEDLDNQIKNVQLLIDSKILSYDPPN